MREQEMSDILDWIAPAIRRPSSIMPSGRSFGGIP
jgi:hypothetical protein